MKDNLKVLYILPIEEGNHDMPYAKRQISSMKENFNIETEIFYLENRSSITYLVKAIKRMGKVIKRFKPDICHAHYGSVNGLFSAIACPKPLVITYHGSDLNKTPTDGLLADFMARFFSNIASLYASQIIIVSNKLKDGLWWRKKKVRLLPVGTNTKEFFPTAQEAARDALGNEFSFSFPTIVFNANQPAIKRLDLAEMAVGLLRNEYPEARLLKLSGKIDPRIMPLLLNASDLLLLCSDNEGSPTMIKEAMACNLLIVSTDVGDVKERINNVNEAVLVKQNATAIYEGMKKILNSTFEKNGREQIFVQELDEIALQNQIYRIYNQLKYN